MMTDRNGPKYFMRLCIFCTALVVVLTSPISQCEATIYATWLTVWNGRDQGWWKASDFHGAKILVAGKWQAIDWTDNAQINEYLDNVKGAGVQVVVADLTNGWGWLNGRCKTIQSLCAKKNLKFCVAENSHGDTKTFESRSQDVWNNFAGPNAAHADTYFQYHGKPLIVCYCIRTQFNAVQNGNGPWRGKFNVVWASGEDSEKNKWVSWSRFSDRKVPLNKVETDLLNQGMFTLSA